MVKKYSYLILGVLLLMSCLGSKSLSLPSKKEVGDFPMNGYYGYYDTEYGSGDYHLIFLYNNGTVFYPRVEGKYFVDNKIDSILNDHVFIERERQDKLNWGIYTVSGSQLIIEKWEPKKRRPTNLNTHIYYGLINRDGSLNINRVLDNYWKREFDLNREYHFRHFSTKPDSTNTFVK